MPPYNNLTSSDISETMVDVCRRLYDRKYVVATSGNISVRTNTGFLITPSSTRKDTLGKEAIVACNSSGVALDPNARPSSEAAMHCLIYEMRKDIEAVIHAHPPFCLACSLVNISLTKMFIAEQATDLGPTYMIPFSVPGTSEIIRNLKDVLLKYNSFIIERHGVVVLGKNLECAYNRLEQLEHVAFVAYLAGILGDIKPFNRDELERIEHGDRSI